MADETPQDTTEARVAAAAELWPSAAAGPHGVVARLSRALSFIASDLEAVAADFELSIASLEALTMLRLAPAPHRLSQRALGELLLRTSGTLSVRLARLERAGLVDRSPDPHDARGMLVELTPRGRALVDRAAAARIDAEAKLVSALSGEEQGELSALLGKLLISLERREAGPRLGIESAPRRAAKELRCARGIAAGIGLLVAAVDSGGLAKQAGVAAGDFILRLNGRQLRSAAQLKRAALEGGELTLTVLRGAEELTVPVRVPSAQAQNMSSP